MDADDDDFDIEALDWWSKYHVSLEEMIQVERK